MKIDKLFFFFFLIPLLVCAQTQENLDKIAPFHEGLAAIQKGSQWGL